MFGAPQGSSEMLPERDMQVASIPTTGPIRNCSASILSFRWYLASEEQTHRDQLIHPRFKQFADLRRSFVAKSG